MATIKRVSTKPKRNIVKTAADLARHITRPAAVKAENQSTARQTVEQILKESEEKYRNLFEYAQDAIIISDIHNGNIIDVNYAGADLLGLPKEKIIGMSNTLIFADDKPGKNNFTTARPQKVNLFKDDTTIKRADGKQIPVNISTKVVNLAGKTYSQTILRDMTDFRRTEKALNQYEQQLAKVFRLSPQQIIITRMKDGMVIDVNDSYTRISGYTREEAMGQTSLGKNVWVNPADRERMLAMLKEKGRVYNEEFKFRIKSGEILTELYSAEPIDINGEQCILAVVTDITGQKRNEQTLKESEERFSKAFSVIPEAISISRVEDGVFLDANESFCRFTGRTREELIGHTGEEIGLFDSNPGQREKIIKTIKEQRGIFNEELITGPGSENPRTILFTTEIIEIGGTPCLISTNMDITGRKRMEQALRESEERFSKAFKVIPESISISRVEDGVILEANETFCNVTGLPREQVIGHSARELGLYEPHKERREEIIAQIKAQHGIYNKELIVNPQSDNPRVTLFSADIVDIGGKPCMISISTDITDRKRMEQALRESEEKFSRAFHAIPQAISISRLKDGVFTDVNNNYCRHNGLNRNDVIGHSAVELGLWDQFDKRDLILESLRRNEPVQNRELEIKDPSGELHYALVSGETITIGGETHVIAIGTDITDRKNTEKALKESEEKFNKAFHTIPDAVAIATLEGGIFMEVNDSFLALNGYGREEVIGHSSREMDIWVNTEDRGRMTQLMENGGRFKNEGFLLRQKTGQIRNVLMSAETVIFNGKTCMLSIGIDITDIKDMEQALRESEEKFSKAFKAIPDSIAISRVSDGVFVDVNDNFCRSIGLTREQIVGHGQQELKLFEKPGQRENFIKRIREQGPITNEELSLEPRTGRPQAVLFSADIIDIHGEPCMISISTNITERRRMEQALRESEEKFSRAFHAIPEAVSISRVEDGVFLDVNESFCREKGYTREEVIGHTVDELHLWEAPGRREEIIRMIKEQGGISNIEYAARTKSGEALTVLLSADIIGIKGEPCMITISNNITERKRMEESLADESIRRRILIDQSSDGIVVLDVNGGVYEANRRFAEMLGYTQVEMKQLHVWEWEYLQSRERLTEMIRTVDEAGDHFETQHRRKDGSTYNVEISTNGALFAGQKLIFCVCRDVTDRKQAEEKLKEAMVELELSSARLKSTNKELESFSYSVSHDLRSPLRSIDGFSQALLEDYAPQLDETAKDYLNRLRHASQKMGDLIDGLLKLSRLTRSEMRHETVDLSALAQEISGRLQETHPERTAEFVIHHGLSAKGDPQMLRVLMENMLGNAWKFTGKVAEARIEFGLSDNGKEPTFFIKDNGAGFDMAFKDKLFGAFQRLHDTADFPGTGIGLATVQRIINRHGGTIRAEAAVGKGAAFYFTLS